MKLMILGIPSEWMEPLNGLMNTAGLTGIFLTERDLAKSPAEELAEDDETRPVIHLDEPPPALVISFLPRDRSAPVETILARLGYFVISMGPVFRFHPLIPLIQPEVNPDHITLLGEQSVWKGRMVALPHPFLHPLLILSSILREIGDPVRIEASWFIPSHDMMKRLSLWDNSPLTADMLETQLARETSRVLGWTTGPSIAEHPVPCHFLICPEIAMDSVTLLFTIELRSPPDPDRIVHRIRNIRVSLDLIHPDYFITPAFEWATERTDPGSLNSQSSREQRVTIRTFRVRGSTLSFLCTWDPVELWFGTAILTAGLLRKYHGI